MTHRVPPAVFVIPEVVAVREAVPGDNAAMNSIIGAIFVTPSRSKVSTRGATTQRGVDHRSVASDVGAVSAANRRNIFGSLTNLRSSLSIRPLEVSRFVRSGRHEGFDQLWFESC